MHFQASPSIVWIALWKVNTYCEFPVNIFSNNINITKCRSFCTATYDNDEDNDDAKAITIPCVFSENSQANKMTELTLNKS